MKSLIILLILSVVPAFTAANSGNAHRCDGSPGETDAKTAVGQCLGDTGWFPDDDMIARVKSGAAWDTAIHRHDAENIPGCIGGCRFNAPSGQADYPVFLQLNDFKAVVRSFKDRRVAGKPSHLCAVGRAQAAADGTCVVVGGNCPPPYNNDACIGWVGPSSPQEAVACTAYAITSTASSIDPADYCAGTTTQVRVTGCTLSPDGCSGGVSCPTSKPVAGTKNCQPQTPRCYTYGTNWTPSRSSVCSGTSMRQTGDCRLAPSGCAGGATCSSSTITRTTTGTKSCYTPPPPPPPPPQACSNSCRHGFLPGHGTKPRCSCNPPPRPPCTASYSCPSPSNICRGTTQRCSCTTSPSNCFGRTKLRHSKRKRNQMLWHTSLHVLVAEF